MSRTNTSCDRSDDEARRAYWVKQMEAAYHLMTVAGDCPVAECGEPLVRLAEAVAGARLEVVFSSTKMAEGCDRLFFLRRGLMASFLRAARAMNERGWVLKVEDAFRTRQMQTRLARQPGVFDRILQKVIWEHRGHQPSVEQVLRRVTVLVATMPKTATHMSGSALDISVLDRVTGAEIDRGGPYLEMSELTPMDSPFAPATARRHRREITELMARCGFVAYPFEFWHYCSGDAIAERVRASASGARYGAVDADLTTGEVRGIADPTRPLNSADDIGSEIKRALRRTTPAS